MMRLLVTLLCLFGITIKDCAGGNIVPGAGYSSDSQQVAQQVCFNAKVGSISNQHGRARLDTALSFSELESDLRMSVSAQGSYAMFSTEAKANYLRSIQDGGYSRSLNYYHATTSNVAVQLGGYGEKTLNEFGLSAYQAGKNPKFGVLCGDSYISSYEQGALLMMGINIKFSSAAAKKEFDIEIGGSLGNMLSATASLKNAVKKRELTGSVVIQAFQVGGDPGQLSKILSKDSTGQYYALTCSLSAMENCNSAASGLLDYAKDEFSKQISFENNKGLTPLGIAFSKYDSIEDIGLTPPASLITPEIKRYRIELSRIFKENLRFQQEVATVFSNRDLAWTTALTDRGDLLSSKAENNIRALLRADGGAACCYDRPDKCIKICKVNLDSELQHFTDFDHRSLKQLLQIRNVALGRRKR